VNLGIGGMVRFLGHRPDVECVYAALDVFVLSSLSEGLSNTILEAMASGVPVVATRVGGADELVEDGRTGILVPAGSGDELSKAVHALASDEARRLAMGTAARVRSEAAFGLRRMIQDYREAYRESVCLSNGATQGVLA
jgi:glycosyltransferase involved in cell wall biosynthesis